MDSNVVSGRGDVGALRYYLNQSKDMINFMGVRFYTRWDKGELPGVYSRCRGRDICCTKGKAEFIFSPCEIHAA